MKRLWIYVVLGLEVVFALVVVVAVLSDNWFAAALGAVLWGLACFAHGFVNAAAADDWGRS